MMNAAFERLCDMITGRKQRAARLLVTIDGPCASGKTTLADRLGAAFSAPVVHTDDYVIPHRLKTPERLGIPGGNCDDRRLAAEVAAPFKENKTAAIRRYDCHDDCFCPPETIPDSDILFLEGSYCNLPGIRAYADVRLFVDAPRAVREARLRRRESETSLKMFFDRWIPLENAYFAYYSLPDEGMIIVSGTEDSCLIP